VGPIKKPNVCYFIRIQHFLPRFTFSKRIRFQTRGFPGINSENSNFNPNWPKFIWPINCGLIPPKGYYWLIGPSSLIGRKIPGIIPGTGGNIRFLIIFPFPFSLYSGIWGLRAIISFPILFQL